MLTNEIFNIDLQKSFIHTFYHIKIREREREKEKRGNLGRTQNLILKEPFSNCALFTGINHNTTKFMDSNKTTEVTPTVVHNKVFVS